MIKPLKMFLKGILPLIRLSLDHGAHIHNTLKLAVREKNFLFIHAKKFAKTAQCIG